MSMPLKFMFPSPVDWPRRIQIVAHRFISWWIEQLLTMLPQRLRAWTASTPDELLLELKNDRIEASVRSATGRRTVGGFDVVGDVAPDVPLRSFLRQQATGRTRALLRLPREKLLVCELRLPIAAKENMRQILGYEMDRYTPFTANQVYFDYRVGAGPDEQLNVRLYTAPRAPIDRILGQVRQLGMTPHAIDVVDETPPFRHADTLNLLPAALRPTRLGTRQLVHAGLWMLSVLLIAVNTAIPFWHQTRHLEMLDGELNQARITAAAAFAIRDRRDALLASLERIHGQHSATPSILQILDELSMRIPDDTWLQRIEIKAGTIQIQGESSAASALIQLLENSALLEDVSFRSPVTQDPRNGQEHFQISAHVNAVDTP